MPSKPSPKGDRRTVRIGKYEVVSRLPSAEGAAIYRAKDAAGKEVCLRILSPELVAQPGVLDRLRREADKIRRLHHDHLLALLELGEDHRTYFLAREYAEGQDLPAYLKARGKLAPGEACRLLSQAAQALGLAHDKGILHGCLHPGSFLIVTAHGRPLLKVADLGPSLRAEADGEGRPARGPVEYLAPEQIRDPTPADGRTDLYALGCALFHMLAGRPPFPEGAAVEQRLQREPPDVRPLNPQVTPALAAVLRKLMARKVEDRYEDVPALLEDLGKLIPPEEPAEPADDGAGPEESAEDDNPAAALAALERGRDEEDEDGEEENERHVRPAPRPGLSARDIREEPADLPDDTEDESPPEKPPRKPSRVVIIGVAVAGGVLAFGAVFALLSFLSTPTHASRPPQQTQPVAAASNPEPRPVAVAPDNRGTPPVGAPQQGGAPQPQPGTTAGQGNPVAQEPPPPSWPVLYQPKKPVERDKLFKEYLRPWAEGPAFPLEKAPVYHVSRLALPPSKEASQKSELRSQKTEGTRADDKKEPRAEEKAKKGTTGDEKKDKGGVQPDSGETKVEGKPAGERWFDSLAAACAAVPEGQPTIIEIADNGPLFEPSIAVTGRRVLVRAGQGFHPLIVWDVAEGKGSSAKADGPAAFLTVTKGELALGQLDVAVKWPEPPAETVALVHATDSDVLAWGCAFSVESRHKAGVAAVRFEGTAPGKRCRLSGCLARGDDLAALDVRAPGAQVLIDGSLLVGNTPPLLRVEGRKDAAPTVRVVRSTLVSGQTLLQLRGVAADPSAPALHWMGWDSLLARAAIDEGGTLVDVPAGASTEGVQWQPTNCLYAGWKTLLTGKKPVEVTDIAAWHERWGLEEGDAAIPNPWNAAVRSEPAEVPPEVYATAQTPMAYRASNDEGLLGCNPATLPVVTDTWPVRTVERFPAAPVEVLADDALPAIPRLNDGKYYGERLDLDKVDLGEHLREVQKKQALGRIIVLHLYGTGERKTTPVRLQGASLVLCFEAPADPARPLVLVPELKSDPVKSNPPQFAVIQVEGGDLDLRGVDIRCADFKTALLPHYLVMVQGGSLRVHKSRLQGPLAHPPDSYWGLLRVEGTGQWQPEWARIFTVNNSVLLSGRIGVHLYGFGWRGRVQNSVLVASTDAFHFQPTTIATFRLNTQLTLERTTVAAKRDVVYLEDTPQLPLVAEPVVIQTRACAFENPFAGAEGKDSAAAGMLVYENFSVPRGLLCWQGEGDAFDRRLQFYAVGAGTGGAMPVLTAAQPFSLWQRLWGPLGERGPLLDLPFKGTLDPETPSLEPLDVPGKSGSVGANLAQLGFKKK